MEKKLGIGRADGAGDAWKVGPAYAALSFIGVPLLGWEEVRPCPFGAGDARLPWLWFGFLPERGGFFLEWTLFDESVAAPAGLMFLGGEDGGVLSRAVFGT